MRILNEIISLAVKGKDYSVADSVDWSVKNHFSYDGAKHRIISAQRLACGFEFGCDAEREILALQINAYTKGKEKITSLEFRIGIADGHVRGMVESYDLPPS